MTCYRLDTIPSNWQDGQSPMEMLSALGFKLENENDNHATQEIWSQTTKMLLRLAGLLD
jgi:hypothetical protein